MAASLDELFDLGGPDARSADEYHDWCLVEMFGRRRVPGLVTADAPDLLHATRLRIDVFRGDADTPAMTMYADRPFYCVTPITEAMARALALRQVPQPIARYELTPPRAGGGDWDDEVDGYRGDDAALSEPA